MMADRQAAVLAAVPDIVMEVDNDKVYTWANDVGRDFFGEDVIGHRAADYFVGEQTTLETVAPLFDGASKETVYVESLQRRKDGEERLLAWWCRPLKDSAGHVIGAISSAHDITDERRAEEVRAATERRYRRILDGLLEGFQIIGRDWRYLYTNDAAARYGRRAKEDLLGKTVMECYPHFVATPAFAALERCMRERTPSLEDVAFVHDDGTESWLMLAVQPLPEGLAVLSLDVTDRKRRQMELDARNAEMERFLYAASHDLRSPLVTVMSFLSYLEDHIMAGAQTEIAEDLGYIKSAATTMDRLLAALLQLSRAGRVTGEPMDIGLEEVVSEARVAVAARLLDRGVELDFRGPNVKLHADRLKLVQLLQNLLENSTKFMGDQATPRIEVGAEGAGRDTVFYVRDNGLGMDPQYIERVFGLFERLDRRASGEGMGLAVVRRIAETYSGRAWAESDGVGHGVTIRFTLPDAVAATEREG
jgi:PAS domain S-box-containing protein